MTKWKPSVILCDLVLAVVINTSAMLIGGAALGPAAWYTGVACAFFTNVLVQLVLPVPFFGQIASKPLEGSKVRPVLSVFVENLVFVTCISFTMALLQAAGRPVVDVWLSTYGYLVLIGYTTSLVLFAVMRRIDKPQVC